MFFCCFLEFFRICGVPSKLLFVLVFSLSKNVRFYNWGYNWVFRLQWTLAIHGIYIALSAIGQVATIVMDTLCCRQYHIYSATHM
jgi:hypothetical protein